MGQFSSIFGNDELHCSLAGRVTHNRREASDTSKLNGSTLAGNEDDLLLITAANEIEEGVDHVDVAYHNTFNLSSVSVPSSSSNAGERYTFSLISFSNASSLPRLKRC